MKNLKVKGKNLNYTVKVSAGLKTYVHFLHP